MKDPVKVPFLKTAVNYALILTAVSVFLSLVFYFTGLFTENWVQIVSGVISIGILVYLMIQYRKNVMGGFASFGQVWTMGFVSSLFSVILGIGFSLLMMYVLFPDMLEAMKLKVEESILSNAKIPEAYVDMAIERGMKQLEPARQLIFGIVGGAVVNAIIMLIIAAFVKKDDPALQV